MQRFMAVTWARRGPGSRHRGEAIVVIERDEDPPVIREDQPLRPAPAAIRVEIGLAIDPARRGGQCLAEIAEHIAADHMPGPDAAQPAAMPAMRCRFVLRRIARRQLPARAQALHRLDKAGDIAQPRFLGEGREGLLVGRRQLRLRHRRKYQKYDQKAADKPYRAHRILASIAGLPPGYRDSMLREDTTTGERHDLRDSPLALRGGPCGR